MDNSEWNALKGEIERLYIKENKKLSEVMQILEITRGFRKTRRQYERRLKMWKVEKNNMTAEKWKIVRRKVEKRRKDDKHSEVYINGVKCPSPKLRREMSRTFESTIERVISAPSPKTPEGIDICSPLSVHAELTGPPRLPWYIFQQAFLAKRRQGFMVQNPISFLSIPRESAISTNSPDRGSLHCLVSWLAEPVASTTSQSLSTPRVIATMRLLMPGLADNQHPLTMDQIVASDNEPHMQKYQVFLYLLSNKSIQLGSLRRQGSNHMVLELLREAGIDTIQKIHGLFSLNGIAAEAMSEGFFGATFRFHDFTAMRLLLDAGIRPDTYIEGGLKALELAAAIHDNVLSFEITRLLLSYEPGLKRQGLLNSALVIAGRGRKLEVCKLLLSAGARTTPKAIRASIISYGSLPEPEIFQIFLDACENINERFHSEHGKTSLLGFAVASGNIPIVECLLQQNVDANVLQEISFEGHACCTTIIGLAARRGLSKLLQILLAHVDLNPTTTGSTFISPIVLGVSGGHKSVVEELVRAGTRFKPTEIVIGRSLIQRAMETGDCDLYWALIHTSYKTEIELLPDFYTFKLIYSLSERDIDGARTLLGLGASVNDLHTKIPNTALGASIETGCVGSVSLLLKSGAVARGYDLLTSIGNMETAVHLASTGILHRILFGSGQILLTTAILTRDTDIVQYLLCHGVDRQREETLHWQEKLFSGTLSRVSSIQRKRYNGLLRFLSPVEAAITCGDYPLVRLLITRGAAVTESILNAAVWGALQSHSDSMLREILLQVQGHLTAPTAVAMGAYVGDIHLVELLLAAGIKPVGEPKVLHHALHGDDCQHQCSTQHSTNDSGERGLLHKPGWWHESLPLIGQSVLLIPAAMGDRALLHILLKSASWTSSDVGRALTISLYSGNSKLAHDLIQANADVNQLLSVQGTTFTPLCCAIQVKDSHLVHTLICHGANVNLTGTTLTPLQRAVENNDPETVNILIDAGADINAAPPASPGANALQIAVKAGNAELIDILLAAGADIDANHGATALQFAAIMGYISIVYRLVAAGANVNAPRAMFYGRTALEGAAEYGRLDMLQVLLNEGAHFTGQFRSQYVRAVKLAEYNGHFAAAKLLRLTGGWSDPDSAQYENEVFDRQEVERFKQINCRQMKSSSPSIIGSKRSSVKEAQNKGRSDGDALTRRLNPHMDGETQKWWDCIDQLIDANT